MTCWISPSVLQQASQGPDLSVVFWLCCCLDVRFFLCFLLLTVARDVGRHERLLAHLLHYRRQGVHDKGNSTNSSETVACLFRHYILAAQLAHDRGQLFWNLTPEFHYLMHVEQELRQQLSAGCVRVLNPAVFSTAMAEDSVGRLSVMSRTVHPLTMPLRVAQKYLLDAKLRWDGNGKGWKRICWLGVCGACVCVACWQQPLLSLFSLLFPVPLVDLNNVEFEYVYEPNLRYWMYV